MSSVQIEAVVNRLEFVKESAAIAISPKGGGPSELVIYYVKNTSDEPEDERLNSVNRIIKKELTRCLEQSNYYHWKVFQERPPIK